MKKSTNDIYPKTLKELRKIDYYDLKKLMKYDDDFFHAVVIKGQEKTVKPERAKL